MNDQLVLTDVPAEADWPVTNCYIDAWLQILRAWDLDPIAALGVTLRQDYEGDQFTFFKFLHEDLERLYGIQAGELAIYTTVEQHAQEQVRRGNLVLVEVDGYYLPDTRTTSYRQQHTKTTIGVDRIDPPQRRLSYFHNAGYYHLDGEDYAGVFHTHVLPPYVEVVKRRWPPLRGDALTGATVGLLRQHLRRRPEQNPVATYRADFTRHVEWLMQNPHLFHEYAFNNFRQLGANWQLLGQHLQWLQARGVGQFAEQIDAAATMSATAKAMQFKVARIASRRRFDACESMFDTLEQNYGLVMQSLQERFG